jgi:F0F1-type ATP synthase membrane subunit b/b'
MRFAVSSRCGRFRSRLLLILVLASIALPAFAQEEAPSPADSPTGMVFRWLNFALVVGSFAWVIAKFGRSFFSGTARGIQDAIHGAAAGRAAAEQELSDATRQLAGLDAEVQELRRTAGTEAAAESERLRALASAEAEKIGKAGAAEIAAAERAARMQLRALAARVAAERAAELVRQRMNEQGERKLFDGFLAQLERGAQ